MQNASSVSFERHPPFSDPERWSNGEYDKDRSRVDAFFQATYTSLSHGRSALDLIAVKTETL